VTFYSRKFRWLFNVNFFTRYDYFVDIVTMVLRRLSFFCAIRLILDWEWHYSIILLLPRGQQFVICRFWHRLSDKTTAYTPLTTRLRDLIQFNVLHIDSHRFSNVSLAGLTECIVNRARCLCPASTAGAAERRDGNLHNIRRRSALAQSRDAIWSRDRWTSSSSSSSS